MSGFILDDATLDQISAQVPNFENLAKVVFKFPPDIISVKYPVESNTPIAAVCLQDMVNTLFSVGIALREYHSHRIWHREKSNPPNEPLAIIMMTYYVDDAVARLYAAGEHLANAIICMLDVDDKQLEPYRKNRISQQSIVGHYLAKELPKNPVTRAVINLAQSNEWSKTIAYRNSWVHEQPPSIKGLGIVYKRRIRWVKNESNGITTHTLGLGGGDYADFSVDEVLDFVQPATFKFEKVCEEVVNFYAEMLKGRGIVITDTGVQITIAGKASSSPA